MRKLAFIILSIIFLIFTGCNEKADVRLLRQADDIIESDPEQADSILSLVDQSSLNEEEYAYYSILKTQADIKNWIIVDSDSLIRHGYDYFRDSGNRNLQMRANFYKAQVSFNAAKYQGAMQEVLSAYEIAKEDKNHYWIAKTAELISDIFSKCYNYPQAEKFTKETIKNYGLAGKELNQRYSYIDLAILYYNQNKHSLTINLVDSIGKIVRSETPIDSILLGYINRLHISEMIATHQFEKISQKELFSLEQNANDELSIENQITKSEIYQNDNQLKESEEVLNEALLLAKKDEEIVQVFYAQYKDAKKKGDFKKATAFTDTLLKMQTKVAEQMVFESVTGVQKDFYNAKAQKTKLKAEALKSTLMISVIAFVIITLLIIWIYRIRVKNKKVELEAALESIFYLKENSKKINEQNTSLSDKLNQGSKELSALQEKLKNQTDEISERSQTIETLFRERWITLNMLCDEYFEKGETEKTRKSILNNIEKEIENLRSKKHLKQIEESVNLYMGDIMNYLRRECDFLKEDDYVFLALVYAGFSVRAICIFLGIKYKFYYLKKSRLKKKIADSEAAHKELFLSKL